MSQGGHHFTWGGRSDDDRHDQERSAGGAVRSVYGVGALIATLVLALDIVLPAWLATLIVAVLLFAVAAVLALVGRAQVKQAVPPVPQDAVQGVKADIEAVTEAVRERGGK